MLAALAPIPLPGLSNDSLLCTRASYVPLLSRTGFVECCVGAPWPLRLDPLCQYPVECGPPRIRSAETSNAQPPEVPLGTGSPLHSPPLPPAPVQT